MLIIQTAFIGDVVLATALLESIKSAYPEMQVDFVVRKGNESLLVGNPHIRRLLVWDKKNGKYKSLFSVSKEIRQEVYDAVINLQRFASSGFLTWRSKSKLKVGFDQGVFSNLFTKKIKHEIGNGKHETVRNLDLAKLALPDLTWCRPKLYPQAADIQQVESLNRTGSYVVMAPSSVWFTKQLPADKWVELIEKQPRETTVFLTGAASDKDLLDSIASKTSAPKIHNLAGQLSLLASAHLMKGASMNFVNDSAPLHLASAMNAPVTAFFCSTIPGFGFGPLSDNQKILEVSENLSCRPCGLHGHKSCPQGHFKCGNQIALLP